MWGCCYLLRCAGLRFSGVSLVDGVGWKLKTYQWTKSKRESSINGPPFSFRIAKTVSSPSRWTDLAVSRDTKLCLIVSKLSHPPVIRSLMLAELTSNITNVAIALIVSSEYC